MTEAPTSAPGRQVVVLRQGPPKRRGAIVDGVVGVVGVALLVMAVYLGQALPEEDVIPKQYLPEFATTGLSVPITYDGVEYPQSILFRDCPGCPGPTREQETYRLTFQVTHDNVFSVRLHVHTPGDDVPGSHADSWSFNLFGPDGEPVDKATQKTLATKPATSRSPDANDTRRLAYLTPSELNEPWRFAAAPEPDFITGGPNFTKEEALLIASREFTIPTQGTWTVVVKARDFGDCPASPTATPESAHLWAACMDATDGSRMDLTNDLTIRSISYDYYTIGIMDE